MTNQMKDLMSHLDSVYQVLLIDVKEEETKIKGKGFEFVGQFEDRHGVSDFEAIIKGCEGGSPYTISSDLFDEQDKEIMLGDNVEETFLEIFHKIIEHIIPYFQVIIREEQMPVLLVSSMDKEKGYMTVSAGLLEDTQIVVLNIKPKLKEPQDETEVHLQSSETLHH